MMAADMPEHRTCGRYSTIGSENWGIRIEGRDMLNEWSDHDPDPLGPGEWLIAALVVLAGIVGIVGVFL